MLDDRRVDGSVKFNPVTRRRVQTAAQRADCAQPQIERSRFIDFDQCFLNPATRLCQLQNGDRAAGVTAGIYLT